MSKGLNQWAKDIHQNAVDHGWWEEDRPFEEIICLFHSELSEALEEFRNGHKLDEVYFMCDNGIPHEKDCPALELGICEKCENPKPEGIPIELADCIIRILDYSGRKDIPIEFLVVTTSMYYDIKNFGKFLANAHSYISKAFDEDETNDEVNKNINLANCIWLIYRFCELNNIDIDAAIEIKHEYNKTRPYKHGGKVI
jgi:hypothetical protein